MSARRQSRGEPSGRFGLILALLGALLGGLVGHHDPLERTAASGGASFAIATAAFHAGSAPHLEASDTEHHRGCAACLLQRQAGFSAISAAPAMACASTDGLRLRDASVAPRRCAANAARGRAPPLA